MKILERLKEHFFYWGESYIVIPIWIGFLLGAVFLINAVTGRSSMEDINAIAGWILQSIGIALAVSLVGMAQHFLFGYRSKAACPMADDIYDACITFALLLLFLPFVFGLFH